MIKSEVKHNMVIAKKFEKFKSMSEKFKSYTCIERVPRTLL